MDERTNDVPQRPIRTRRKKRSKMQIFKESYLPVIIAGAAVLMVIIFIIGSVSRSSAKRKAEKEASLAASQSEASKAAELDAEAARLLEQAEYLASGYDYQGAIAAIDSFSGTVGDYVTLSTKRAEYVAAQESMVAWDDLSKVVNLSFNMLVADPARAYADTNYGTAYRNNFVTVSEFSQILQQLYDNNYILVSIRDLIDVSTNADGEKVYAAKTLYLPEGKTPFILTETGVNYNIYMVDGDGDNLPDKDGAGFASKLVLDSEGKIVSEMVDASGNTVTGAYDLVPILEAFIAEHPDFSLRGARAILAVSGYNGVFGYRINSEAKTMFGEEAYNKDIADAAAMADILRSSGYELACYTYKQISYSSSSAEMIQQDQQKWASEILPVIGNTDIMVYFKVSDIGDTTVYSGDKYSTLQSAGYGYYIGASSSNASWAQVTEDYVRQHRIWVTGSALESNAQQFESMFDAAALLDSARSK